MKRSMIFKSATFLSVALSLTACHQTKTAKSRITTNNNSRLTTASAHSDQFYFNNKRADIKNFCNSRSRPSRCADLLTLCTAYYDKYASPSEKVFSKRSRRYFIRGKFFKANTFSDIASDYGIKPSEIKSSAIKNLPLFCRKLLVKSGVRDNIISNVADGVAATSKSVTNTTLSTAKQLTNTVTKTITNGTD